MGVISSLLSQDKRDEFAKAIRDEYALIRETRGERPNRAKMLTLADARKRKFAVQWGGYAPPHPAVNGIQVFGDYPLAALVDYIDWTPFFIAWESREKFPRILEDEIVGKEADKFFGDAQALLGRIVDEKLLTPKAVIGLFPANAVDDDDIEVYTDESRTDVLTVLHHLRQQSGKPSGRPNCCLNDFIAPKKNGIADYVGAFAVTTGLGTDELCATFEKEHDDYNSIMTKAFAEQMHERVRKEFWDYAPDEVFDNEDLITEKYAGIRPAPGYPACPDYTEKRSLFNLLNVEENTGIGLTENLAMFPAAPVSGWYFSHPESRHFSLGKIDKAQVENYARCKGP